MEASSSVNVGDDSIQACLLGFKEDFLQFAKVEEFEFPEVVKWLSPLLAINYEMEFGNGVKYRVDYDELLDAQETIFHGYVVFLNWDVYRETNHIEIPTKDIIKACVRDHTDEVSTTRRRGARGLEQIRKLILHFHQSLCSFIVEPKKRQVCVMKIMPMLMMGRDMMTIYPVALRRGIGCERVITYADFENKKLYITTYLYAFGCRFIPKNKVEEEELSNGTSEYLFDFLRNYCMYIINIPFIVIIYMRKKKYIHQTTMKMIFTAYTLSLIHISEPTRPY